MRCLNLIFTLLLFNSFISFSQVDKNIEILIHKINNTKDEKLVFKDLDSLTNLMNKTNYSNQPKYFLKMISLAKEKGSFDLAAEKARDLARYYNDGGKADEAIRLINELLKDRKKYKSKRSLGLLYIERSFSYALNGSKNESLKDIDKSIYNFSKAKDSIWLGQAICTKAEHYSNYGELINGLTEYYKAYGIFTNIKYDVGTLRSLSGISSLFFSHGLTERSIEEGQKALNLALKNKNNLRAADMYLELSESYYILNNYKKQKETIDKAINLYNKEVRNDLDWRYFHAHRFYAKYYLKMDNMLMAKESILTSEMYLKKTHAINFFAPYLSNVKGEYFRRTLQLDKSLESYNELLNKDIGTLDSDLILEAEKGIAEVYALMNQYNKAYKHIKIFQVLNDSINNTKTINRYLYYQTVYETTEKEKKILKQEIAIKNLEKAELKKQKKRQIIYVFLFFLSLIIFTIIYYIFTRIKKRKKELEFKLKLNEKELNLFTKELISRSKEKESLKIELEKLKAKFGEIKEVEKLESLATSKILTEDDWIKFKQKFNAVFPLFFATIEKNGFELTKSEQRLVALEKLKLDSNEVSNLLGISQDSIRKIRYRLRKKNNASSEIDISTYLYTEKNI